MNCQDSRELLIEYSLGQLDPARTSEVRAHLAKGCAVCAEQLTQIQDSWAGLAASLEPVAPSPEVEKKLLAMIRGEIALADEVGPRGASRERTRFMEYVLAASLVGIAAGVVVWKYTPLQSSMTSPEVAESPAKDWGAPGSDANELGFQTVSLAPLTEQQGVNLAIIMNKATRQWHVIGSGLPAVAAGEHYQLWLETKSEKFLPMKQLAVDSDGHGGVIVDLPEEHADQLAGVWLTVEKAEQSVRPSEHILFRAAIK